MITLIYARCMRYPHRGIYGGLMIGIFAALAVQSGVAAATQTEKFHLICEGGKSVSVATSSTSAVVTTERGGNAIGSSITSQPVYRPMTVQFRLENGLAELNVPAVSGVKQDAPGGWSKVKDLHVTENDITGKVSMGWLVKSTFRIDRRTGIMTTEGGYQGDCRPMDMTQRKF